ncbi:VanZ family protein [Cellvibrio sp. QJXJ]|jgi:VanZ family protein|uniref:VanZ family protein n=1 Tax=Cellvibrio sp. QJXJ TaxID=2964606 RepID=UPI0021C2F624|nr:VanZ family protein [Cellvibrio sp. QJXJ]UUA74346.1 VanZ family protein [Cellvibrio sp. QJXJ]
MVQEMAWRFLCVIQFYLLLVIYTYLGLTPHPENSVPVFNDLLMHFAGYAVAAISINFARPYWPGWQQAVVLILYSIAIEIAQHFNPPRTFSIADIIANTTGVALGLAIIFILTRYCSWFSSLLFWKIKARGNTSNNNS